MSNLVIVAIPDENDRVWQVSSEQIPHMTLLFLGEGDNVANLEQIVLFVEHAANTALRRFSLPVDHRGELGADQADVLFFKKSWGDYKLIRDFRAALLQDTNIKTAYDSSPQFDGPWQPHLTLGYPASPAKSVPDDLGTFYDVSFNRLAVWTDDFDGPEFLLKDPWDEFEILETIPMDVPMSDVRMSELEHHGVKGMRWGVRKEDVGGAARSVGRAAKSAGGGVAKAAKATGRFVGDVNFEARVESGKAREAVISAAQKPYKKEDLPAIKARHGDYAKLRNRARRPFSPEAKAYRKDARETYIKRLESTANSMTNTSGNRQYTIRERGIDLPAQGGDLPRSRHYWDVSARDVKHAAEDAFTRLELVMEDGYIVDLKPVEIDEEQTMAQTMAMGEAFLEHCGIRRADPFDGSGTLTPDFFEHFGVKGMHWGVRRDRPSPMAVTPTAVSTVPHGNKRKTKIDVAGGENHPAHEDAIRVAEARTKLKKSGTAALSNQELREVANRLQLEAQVATLSTSRGQKFVMRELETGSQQLVKRGVKKGVKRHGPTVAKKAGKVALALV